MIPRTSAERPCDPPTAAHEGANYQCKHMHVCVLTMVLVRADTLVTKPESARLPML